MKNPNRDVLRAPAWRRYLTFWRTPIAQDVDDELRFHTIMRVKELMARGMPEDEAQRAVAERLGDVDAAKSECVELSEVRERNKRSAAVLDAFRNDLRYAIRGLRARPGFAAAIIVTLGLGIGANAAVFSVVDRLLFRTAPMLRDASRTHRIYVSYPAPSGEGTFMRDVIPYVRYKQISAASGSFLRTATFGVGHSVVGAPEDGRDMQVAGVSASFFNFFDAAPRLGRYFTQREDVPPAGDPVVVLSYGIWQTEYGGRDDALGAKIQIGQTMYTVIGVAPRWFAGLWPDEPPIAYIPFAAYGASMNYAGRGDTWWTSTNLDVAGLLMTRKPGVSVEMATTDLTHEMREHWSDINKGSTPVHQPTAIVGSTIAERGPRPSETAQVAALVGAMALVVLLIAGANVANLLLARALRRRREIAVRLALGISRPRLVSQLITETLLLAFLGGITGLIVARWGGPALRATFLEPSVDTSVVTDVRTLTFVGLAVVLAGIATGLAPAWQAGRLDVTRFLRIGAREGMLQRSPLRASLLVIQAALSVLLLVAAGLFVRSLDEARHLHMGYDVDRLLIVGLNMRGVRLDSARSDDLWQRLTNASRAVPGVERVATARDIPLLEVGIANIKRPPEMDSLRYAQLPLMVQNIVMPGFFETMGTRILRGRALDSTDGPGSTRAVVVSNRFAQTFWPEQDAIGQCVMNGRGVCAYVVGVAEDIRYMWMNDDPGLQLYTSAAQNPPRLRKLFVRIRGNAEPYAEGLRAVLQREMPGASYVTVTPYSDVVGNAMKSWQLGATVFVAFGVLAMLLAAIGLYSAISYNVTQRTHEMGVRRALGAQAADVIQLIMRQGVLLGGIGVLLGGVLAWVAADRIEPLLFKVSARDPFVFAFVIIAMLGVAIAASFVPARRAASVDPNVALRSE
jgi:predicted permease